MGYWRLGLPYGVYPKHELSGGYEASYSLGKVTLLTKEIDRECDLISKDDRIPFQNPFSHTMPYGR